MTEKSIFILEARLKRSYFARKPVEIRREIGEDLKALGLSTATVSSNEDFDELVTHSETTEVRGILSSFTLYTFLKRYFSE